MSDRIRRQIGRLLDDAEAAFAARDWIRLKTLAGDVIKLDPENPDAAAFLTAAESGAAEDHQAQRTDVADASTLSESLVSEARGDSMAPGSEGGEPHDFAGDDGGSGYNANPLERLNRGVFVGREAELATLREAFDEALAGRGSIAVLAGEPGIGKTRVLQELSTYVRLRGGEVLWGRCDETRGAPPYWPWLEIGQSFWAGNGISAVRQALGVSFPELLPMFPDLRTLVPDIGEPQPAVDAASARFRLFAAYTAATRAIAAERPLLLALDDVHWADHATLLLLRHLGRDLPTMRVLVVATYRDTELGRTHPLSETLAALNREADLQRLPLRRLAKDEVAAYIRATTHAALRPQILDRVFEETEGNPFFLVEVVNLMAQEGTLWRESLSDVRVPDGVKEALGRRLDHLSPEANDLLQTAAVVGREFAYEALKLVSSHDDETLIGLLEEGLDARVIDELTRPAHYQFTHALMQETLLAELSTARRLRLHGQIGEALEARWGDEAERRAPELARHFSEAAALSGTHVEKAGRYSLLAGEQAEAQFAWAEAM